MTSVNAQKDTAFVKNIDILKRTFLQAVTAASTFAANTTDKNQALNSLGLCLEEINYVCDELYIQISTAKRQIVQQELIRNQETKLKEAEAGKDIVHSRQVRQQILDDFTQQIEEISKLKEFIKNLPSSLEDDMEQEEQELPPPPMDFLADNTINLL